MVPKLHEPASSLGFLCEFTHALGCKATVLGLSIQAFDSPFGEFEESSVARPQGGIQRSSARKEAKLQRWQQQGPFGGPGRGHLSKVILATVSGSLEFEVVTIPVYLHLAALYIIRTRGAKTKIL